MPGFVGGLAQGLQGLPDEVGQLIEHMRNRKAAEALMKTYGGQGQPPQGQPPQAGPGPAPHPAAGLAAMGGGGSAPPPQAGPAPFKPGAPPAPGQPDPLAVQPPAPQPGAPTGAPGAEAPTGMAVDPAFADPVKEAQSLNANLWKSTMAANPKADPLTILKAVQMQIDNIKAVAPITKSAMQGQLMMIRENLRASEFDQKELRLWKEHSDKLTEAYKSDKWKEAVAEENSRFKGEMVSVAKDRANIYQDSVDYQHDDRVSAESGRDTRNTENNDTRRDISGDRSDDSTYRSDQGFRGAQVRSGQPADPAPQRPARRAGGGAPVKAGLPANVQQFAKQHGLTIVRKRADGKYDAKTKDGTVGVIG